MSRQLVSAEVVSTASRCLCCDCRRQRQCGGAWERLDVCEEEWTACGL